MTDEVFSVYSIDGKYNRSDYIISETEREQEPLNCDEDGRFVSGSGDDQTMEYVRLNEEIYPDVASGRIVEGQTVQKEVVESSEVEKLPGVAAIASDRQILVSYDGIGSLTTEMFETPKAFIIAIASTGGVLNVSIDSSTDTRSLYGGPPTVALVTYETVLIEEGAYRVVVNAEDSVSWQTVILLAN